MNDPPSREETIFEAARQMSEPQQQAAYLDNACGDDFELRRRVESLLRAGQKAKDFFQRHDPAALLREDEDGSAAGSRAAAGSMIGRYKLLQKIGEGGMGVVYMAEQEEPVRRRVALKIIKLGMDTRQVVARFEAERQALALMDHPNIARVLDGGATETGRPYFVMELVQGVPITEFCDKNRLSVQERLKLFVPVCQAIQSAHQKGIIHRDVKPSNILVGLNPEGSGFPKIIDFGVAKAISQQLTEKTLFTAHGMMVGTPAYMSPEQAEMSNLDVDTRADIYSLGALLYELLTGSPPFPEQRLRSAGYNEIQRIILEEQPVKPSTRLSTLQGEQRSIVARNRGTTELSLGRVFSSDLDWIVMKCLEKNRARRYDTVNSLAHDLERHLRNEPVTARPPSRLYEFQKTVRRHWVGFAAVVAVLLALGIGVVVSSLEAIRARRAEQNAQGAQASEARQRTSAQQLLYNSLVGEARATSLARRVGYRDKVFDLLKRAKALDVPQKNLADLRQEAVACLGDFVGLTPATFTNFPAGQNELGASLAPSGKLAAFAYNDGTLRVCEMPTGKELARLPYSNGIVRASRFSVRGDQLFAVAGSKHPAGSYALPMPQGSRVKTWIYGWTRVADGHWRESRNGELPGATLGLFSTEAGVFDVILDRGPLHASDTLSGCARFRLLNLSTGAFVPGCEVTNDVSSGGDMNFCVSRDGQLLAVETTETHSPDESPTVNLYRWNNSERIGQLRLPQGGRLGFGGDQPARNLFYHGAGGPLVFSDDAKCLIDLSGNAAAIYTVPGLERMAQLREMLGPGSVQSSGKFIARLVHAANCIDLLDLWTQRDIALLDEPEDAGPTAFSGNGDCLLTTGERHARLYQLWTPEKVDLQPHAGAVPGAAFSRDGLRLASVGHDWVLKVSDALTGQVLWETNDLADMGQCVSFSPDGQLLAIGCSHSDLVRIRDAQTGKRLLELGDGRAGPVCSALFSADGRYLAMTGDFTNGTKIWTIQRGQARDGNGALEARLIQSWTGGKSLVFAPDGRLVAFVGLEDPHYAFWECPERPIYAWDFKNSAQPQRLVASRIMGYVECEGFTPDGRRLVALEDSGAILTLDATTGKRLSACYAQDALTRTAVEVQLSPDGTRLAVGVKNPSGGAVSLSDPKTGRHLYSLPVETGAVHWLAWSPDGRRLAVARETGKIAIWDLEVVKQVLTQLGLNP